MFSRRITTTLAFAVLASMPLPLSAQGNYEREFQKIVDDRNNAMEAAAAPINRRYRESLEQLLLRATQNNDLDTALKIKRALTNPIGKWKWTAGRVINIKDNGTFTVDRGSGGKWRWTESDKGEFTMIWDGSDYVDTLIIAVDGNNISGANNKGNRVNSSRLK